MRRYVGYEAEWARLPFSAAPKPPDCRRTAVKAPAVLFCVEDLLSSDECAALRQAAAPHQQPVDWEYVAEYRSCARAVMLSEVFR